MARKVKSLEEKEEAVLARAVASTMRAYNENPTTKNLKEWDAAKRRFAEFQRSKAANAEPRFGNLREVHAYLLAEGYKVSQSKLYDDERKIEKENDGSILLSSIEKYIKLVSLPKRDGSGQDDSEWTRETQLKNDILEQKLKDLKRENEIAEGKWVLKSEAEQKHTAKLALLMTAFDNFVHGGKLEEACELVGGSKEKVAELAAFMKKEVRHMLGEYAKRPEFSVPKQAVTEAEELIKEVEG